MTWKRHTSSFCPANVVAKLYIYYYYSFVCVGCFLFCFFLRCPHYQYSMHPICTEKQQKRLGLLSSGTFVDSRLDEPREKDV